MPLDGKTIIPRLIAAECKRYWSNYELTKAVATALGESAGSLGAYHDNLTVLSDCYIGQEVLNPELYYHMAVINPTTGKIKILPDGPTEMHPPESEVITTRDLGLFQINRSASIVGTDNEKLLRTTDLDPAVYEPVMRNNIDVAFALYDTAWSLREGVAKRHWQPWVAYTSGWATFPEFWVWHQDADGNPVGPWVKTGRYIQRAISGQMNYHILVMKDWTVEQALYYGKRYATHFEVKAPLQASKATEGHPSIVGFVTPPMPTEPPADGVGPRPTPNSGI
jgi:hypothetical protein